MGYAVPKSRNPPLIANAGAVTPRYVRIARPKSKKHSATTNAVPTARTNVERRRVSSNPFVKPRNIGTMPKGSTTTISDVNAVSAYCIISVSITK
jgi:hypothetical protein